MKHHVVILLHLDESKPRWTVDFDFRSTFGLSRRTLASQRGPACPSLWAVPALWRRDDNHPDLLLPIVFFPQPSHTTDTSFSTRWRWLRGFVTSLPSAAIPEQTRVDTMASDLLSFRFSRTAASHHSRPVSSEHVCLLFRSMAKPRPKRVPRGCLSP